MVQLAHPRNPLRGFAYRLGLLAPPPDAASESDEAAGGAAATVDAYVAGLRRISGLSMRVEASEVREGGNSLHAYAQPDRATWEPIKLEQGLALSDTLERWAAATVEFLRTGTAPSEPIKRNAFIDVWDPNVHAVGGGGEGGTGEERLRRYLVFNAWISSYQAIPELDAMSDEVALLSVELTHEGWRVAGEGEVPSDIGRLQGAAGAAAQNGAVTA